FVTYGCEDTELGVRLEQMGCPIYFHAPARLEHDHPMDLGGLERRQRAVARAHVALFTRHPQLLHEPAWVDLLCLDGATIARALEQRAQDLARCRRLVAQLGPMDDAALGALAAQKGIRKTEAERALLVAVQQLNAGWWQEGLSQGLAEAGLRGFADLVRGWYRCAG
ncbi:MAG: hypothetical protein AAGA56_11930, partial [Myxococcota bacterium]